MTAKRHHVIKLVADGLKNREIAVIVGRTEYGIKNELRRIFEELGFSNRVELALWFVKKEFDAIHF